MNDPKIPRRFRTRLEQGLAHPWHGDRYIYGCYFPAADLMVTDMGQHGQGEPQDVEWIDDPRPRTGVQRVSQ